MRVRISLITMLLALGLRTTAATCQTSSATKVDPALNAIFPESIRTSGVLRIGVSAPQPPFVIQDQPGSQEYQGIDPDLARAVAERAGLRVEFPDLAF